MTTEKFTLITVISALSYITNNKCINHRLGIFNVFKIFTCFDHKICLSSSLSRFPILSPLKLSRPHPSCVNIYPLQKTFFLFLIEFNFEPNEIYFSPPRTRLTNAKILFIEKKDLPVFKISETDSLLSFHVFAINFSDFSQ